MNIVVDNIYIKIQYAFDSVLICVQLDIWPFVKYTILIRLEIILFYI